MNSHILNDKNENSKLTASKTTKWIFVKILNHFYQFQMLVENLKLLALELFTIHLKIGKNRAMYF